MTGVGLSLHTLSTSSVIRTADRTVLVVHRDLDTNQLSGSIAESLGNLINLQYLYVQSQTPHTDS